MHVVATLNATVHSNNTLSGGHVSHVGQVIRTDVYSLTTQTEPSLPQVFFDQDLLTSVDTVSPYSTNTQEVTLNSADSILAEEADSMDPFLQYVLLGDDISEGILAWISIGIDTTQNYTTTAASIWTDNGGVANSNSVGGGSPPSGGNGTFSPNGTSSTASASASAAAASSSSSASQNGVSALLGLFAFVWAL